MNGVFEELILHEDKAPSTLSHSYDQPVKGEAIKAHKSRFLADTTCT